MAKQTLVNFLTKASRLYERERGGAPDALGISVRRWVRWARAGLGEDAIKEKTATQKDRRFANRYEGFIVRQQLCAFCASR